jgi:hypothetical protein
MTLKQFELVLTLQQEKLIDKKFKHELNQKKKEIKQEEKRSNKLQKYSAYFYIKKEPVIKCKPIFNLSDNNSIDSIINSKLVVDSNIDTDLNCILRLVTQEYDEVDNNLIIYKIDSDLSEQLFQFLERYNDPKYEIVLQIKSMDHFGLYYSADGHPIHCTVLISSTDQVVINYTLEIQDKYELVCG